MNTSSKAVSTPNSRSKEKDLEILSDLFIKSVKNIGKEILISYSKIRKMKLSIFLKLQAATALYLKMQRILRPEKS